MPPTQFGKPVNPIPRDQPVERDDTPLAQALDGLSQVAQRLFFLSSSAPAGQFRNLALAAIRQRVPFDMAFWSLYEGLPEQAIGKPIQSFRWPLEHPNDEARQEHLGSLIQLASRQLGLALEATAATLVGLQSQDHGLGDVICTALRDAGSGVTSGMVFCRTAPAGGFDETERLWLQNLVPFLVTGWNNSLIRLARKLWRLPSAEREACAVCGADGLLQAATPDFIHMMRMEWPLWQGPRLPGAIRDTLVRGRCVGRGITVTTETLGDAWALNARDRHSLDELSAREFAIAQRYGTGMDHQDIARTLCIAPSTVRNHLKNIYGKLGIDNKAMLAYRLSEIELPAQWVPPPTALGS